MKPFFDLIELKVELWIYVFRFKRNDDCCIQCVNVFFGNNWHILEILDAKWNPESVRAERLELSRREALDPKSSMSTNSITPAHFENERKNSIY